MPRIYVGTSGWSYGWNPDGFDWYIANSGLNSVELNASFYRFPLPSMVSSWSRKTPRGFRWAIKVNRLITHVYRFGEKSLGTWAKFRALMEPLDEHIDFYLFQLPPSSKPTTNFLGRIESFISQAKLGERFALEYRCVEWFGEAWIRWAARLGITTVSVDSPDFPREIYNTNGLVYVRMHGRTAWYAYCYSDEELADLVRRIEETRPERSYIYFNNDHDMLNNAQTAMRLMAEE